VSKNPTIVVIGDWFIDENWLVSKQKLFHSSHTGDIHYQARHETANDRIISLCGAAELLEVLRSFHEAKEKSIEPTAKHQFIGFGVCVWNPIDHDAMQCIMCEEHQVHKYFTPFTLFSLPNLDESKPSSKAFCPCTGKSCSHRKNRLLKLHNFAEDAEKGRVSTNRIIRCYQGFGGGEPHLLYRFDWFLPIYIKNADWYSAAFKILKNNTIDAIIIEDHGHGVITPECIEKLIGIQPSRKKTPWFIRTKLDNPPWMKVLHNNRIVPELIVVDHHLADQKKGARRWWHGENLSRAALELLGEISSDIIHKTDPGTRRSEEVAPERVKAESVAVLLDDNTVFAKSGNKCFCINQPPGKKQIINVGRTTIFFAALIAQKLSKAKINFGDQCARARDCAYKWSVTASNSWDDQKASFFYGKYNKALNDLV